MNFEEFLKSADVLLVDNAFAFSADKYEDEISDWILEELDDEAKAFIKTPKKKEFFKYKLDEDKIEKIIEKLKTSTFYIADYWKTKQFLKAHDLKKEDLEEVIKNLEKGDYKTNSRSEDNVAIIFVKNSKIKELGPFHLYIKLDYDSIEEQPVIVISFHE